MTQLTDKQGGRVNAAVLIVLVVLAAAALAAAKNTYDIKWILKNEMVLIQCK